MRKKLLILNNCINAIRRAAIVGAVFLVPAIGYSAIGTHSNSTDDVITLPAESHSLSFILATDASVDQKHILATVPVPAILPLFISSTLSGLVAIKSKITMKYSWFVLGNQVGNRGQAMFLYVYET